MTLKISQFVLYALGYFIVAVSLVPLIRNDNWVFRVFEYPRAQKLILNIAVLALFLPLAHWDDTHATIFTGLLVLNALYLFYQVFPYTVLSKHQMKGQKTPLSDRHFKLLVCNVYQDNRNVDGCLALIRGHKPDIILFVETDLWWKEHLDIGKNEYPYRVLKPLDNTYGMMLYSRFELVDPLIKYLVKENIPSIHTRVRLLSGDEFFLYCVHPQPPVPNENPRSTERDAELLTVAREARERRLPVIVAGDLNDVAWSYTTELFMKISGLLDPRRGRGFFNTFHARYWFLRWPLDHIFCSSHFQLVDLKRLPPMGSDHFPILLEVVLDFSRSEENREEELEADGSEREVAGEKIAKAR